MHICGNDGDCTHMKVRASPFHGSLLMLRCKPDFEVLKVSYYKKRLVYN